MSKTKSVKSADKETKTVKEANEAKQLKSEKKSASIDQATEQSIEVKKESGIDSKKDKPTVTLPEQPQVEKSAKQSVAAITDNQLAKTDGAVKNKPYKKGQRPGRLLGSLPFEIHTIEAQRLFSGNTGKDAMGLLRFGGQMTEIWEAAEQDDPYADWYLVKVYDGIVKLRNQLATVTQDYQAKIQEVYGRANLPLTPFASQKPIVRNLWFRTQYGYLGANLVADFDELMRVVLTANRVGVLLDKPQDAIRVEWIDKINGLFQLPFKWQAFKLTRADVEANNDLAKSVHSVLGKLPEAILNKTLRAPFSPFINIPTEIKQEAVDPSKTTEAEK